MSEPESCDLCGAVFDDRGSFMLGEEGWIVCADCRMDNDPAWLKLQNLDMDDIYFDPDNDPSLNGG